MSNKKEYDRKYCLKHKEKMKALTKKYRLEHKEENKEYSRKYYIEHKAEMEKHMHKYYLLHKEKIKERAKKYQEEHKEEAKKRKQKYNKQHRKEISVKGCIWRHRTDRNKKYNIMSGLSDTPEYKKMKRANRRALFRNAGKLTVQTIQQVYDENIIANGGVLRCIYCHKELAKREATLEHKQPLSRGGTNTKENLAIACMYCNISKGDKTVEEFRNYFIRRSKNERYIGIYAS